MTYRWGTVAGFAFCGIACFAPFLGRSSGVCGACTDAAIWQLSLAGLVTWCLAAWIAWIHVGWGIALGAFAVSGHAGVVFTEWSSACGICLGVLALEVLVWTGAVFWSAKRNPVDVRRMLLRSLLGAAAGAVGGAAVLPTAIYAGCPESYRSAMGPRWEDTSENVVVLLKPDCPVCETLKTEVLPRFRSKIHWFELSKCDPTGRRLIRAHGVGSFPSILVMRGGQLILQAQGLDEVRGALRVLTKDAGVR